MIVGFPLYSYQISFILSQSAGNVNKTRFPARPVRQVVFSGGFAYNGFHREAIALKRSLWGKGGKRTALARVVAAVCAVLVALSAFLFLFLH